MNHNGQKIPPFDGGIFFAQTNIKTTSRQATPSPKEMHSIGESSDPIIFQIDNTFPRRSSNQITSHSNQPTAARQAIVCIQHAHGEATLASELANLDHRFDRG